MNMNSDTFQSADGSTRCAGCHLHLDACTCSPDHPLRFILLRVLGVALAGLPALALCFFTVPARSDSTSPAPAQVSKQTSRGFDQVYALDSAKFKIIDGTKIRTVAANDWSITRLARNDRQYTCLCDLDLNQIFQGSLSLQNPFSNYFNMSADVSHLVIISAYERIHSSGQADFYFVYTDKDNITSEELLQ